MKAWLKLVFLIPAAIFVLVAEVKTDYSHSVDFSHYKTYSWLKVEAEDTLWQDRIQRDVDAELSSKGWQRVASGGDASVAAVGSVRNERQLQTFYDSFGGDWFWRGFDDGVATTTVQNVPVGTLNVDIFDGTSKKLIWRGTAEKALSGDPQKNEKKLKDVVADMFKKYPPPSKG